MQLGGGATEMAVPHDAGEVNELAQLHRGVILYRWPNLSADRFAILDDRARPHLDCGHLMSLKHCLVVILAPTLLLLGCGSPPSAAPASSPPASSAAPASKPAASPSQASAAAAVSAKPAASSAPKPAASASAKPAASGAAASAKPSAPAATPTARTGGDPQGFPIRFQSGSPALSSIVLYAALDEGFFKDQHLAVSIIPVAGGLPTLGALTKGEIEFNTNPGDSIQGANQGLPLKVVYSTWAKSPWT